MEQEVIDEIIQARGRKNLESQLITKFTSKKFLKEKLQTVSAATRVVDTLDFVADAKSAVHVLLRAFELAEDLPAQLELCPVTAKLLLSGAWTAEYLEKPSVQFLELVRTFTEVSVHSDCAYQALAAVEHLVHVRKAPQSFSSIHTDFVLLCLVSRQYSLAAQRLAAPIRQVSKAEKGLQTTPLDLMKYYYYGGRVYTGLKQFSKALRFFKVCITLPALSPSAVVAEALKFFALISLMLEGKVEKHPKHASAAVQRLRNPEAYTTFIQKYQQQDLDGVVAVLEKEADCFKNDGTYGLAKQSLRFLKKRIVKQQTHTYLTVSLQDIGNATKSSKNEVESILVEMIASGEINASVDQEKGTVEFIEFSGANQLEKLEAQLHSLRVEVAVLQGIEDDVSTSKNYVKKVTQRNSSNIPQQGGGAIDMMEMTSL